jgi:antirestriction protein ArdC
LSKDIYEIITERFLDALKKGTVPWQRPWLSAQNMVSQKPYRGINAILLGCQQFESPFWVSFKQAKDLGGNVKKGSKATPVIYFKILDKKDGQGQPVAGPDGKPGRIPLVRWSNVFNLDQTEGIEAPAIAATQGNSQPIEKAAAIVADTKLCPIYHTGFAALYSPKDDVIRMPKEGNFRTQEDYYHTLFHEMTHATGHSTRLDREGITKPVNFGSERYSKEELIAEIGAAFLSNEAGILDGVQFDNSAAYLCNWMERLGKDPKLVVSAASQAHRASDFIRGVQHVESAGETQTTTEGMPLSWAKENGIDTCIPGFAHLDVDGDGASALTEWKHGSKPLDQLSLHGKTGMKLGS